MSAMSSISDECSIDIAPSGDGFGNIIAVVSMRFGGNDKGANFFPPKKIFHITFH